MNKWLPIKTARLVLRELISADIETLQNIYGDYESRPFEPLDAAARPETEKLLYEMLDEQGELVRGAVTLGITNRQWKSLIGTISLRIQDQINRGASIGYIITKAERHHGYATEAARAVIEAAFSKLRLHRIWADCDTRNVASYKVMEKIGMRREGLLRKNVLQGGSWRDSYLYAIVSDETETSQCCFPSRVKARVNRGRSALHSSFSTCNAQSPRERK